MTSTVLVVAAGMDLRGEVGPEASSAGARQKDLIFVQPPEFIATRSRAADGLDTNLAHAEPRQYFDVAHCGEGSPREAAPYDDKHHVAWLAIVAIHNTTPPPGEPTGQTRTDRNDRAWLLSSGGADTRRGLSNWRLRATA